ncbi:hypothetical protein QBC42DRAFT_189309, partial [Cladorrhinum samala]
MASHSILHQRDGDDTSKSSLSPGAIAGIACGSAALFLIAGVLFFIYWRRDRKFDGAENFYQRRLEGHSVQPGGDMMPNLVSYTMDHKMDSPRHKELDGGSSYTYSPDKPAYPFSPLSVSEGGASSAMPTHPAYIPRAFVRGVSSSNHSRTTSASTHQHLTTTMSSSPPFSSSTNTNHKNNSNNSHISPDDMLVQAYLSTASGEPFPSALLPQPRQ